MYPYFQVILHRDLFLQPALVVIIPHLFFYTCITASLSAWKPGEVRCFHSYTLRSIVKKFVGKTGE